MEFDLAIAGLRGFDPLGAAGAGASSAGETSAATAAQAGPTFADALRSAATTTVNDLRNAEHISLKAISGEADMRDVADAVMSAEQNLQAAIAIRDKIVTAFLEISRMQI